MPCKLTFLILLLAQVFECLAQDKLIFEQFASGSKNEIGQFYHRNYIPKEYNAAFQNWGGLQDKQGIMFFANNDGVLVYDGKTWSLIVTPSRSNIRSLAMDQKGKIFVGALDDLGYLDKLNNGSYAYVSLLDKLKSEWHGMGNIWQTYVHNNFVYFESDVGLFSWNGDSFQFWPWPNPDAYHVSFAWNNSIYMQEDGIGLTVLKDNKFTLAPKGEFFKSLKIYSTIPSGNKIQFTTRYDGIFIYDGKSVRHFQTEADSYFKENQIYCSMMLSDSSCVYGTRLGGAVIIDKNGAIRYLINNQNGLPTNIVLGMTKDHEENIWFSLDNGISKFEINNGLSFYNNNTGLEGAVNSLCRYNNKLYAATNSGLYFLKDASFPKTQSHFEKVPGINMSCWYLLKVDNRMLVSSNQGMFEIVGNELHQITESASFAIHRYKADSNRIVVALFNGLQSLKLTRRGWQEAGFVKDVNLDNISFTEVNAGRIWLCTFSQGAALLSFPEADGIINYDMPTVKLLDQANGLPEGSIRVNRIGGREIFQVSNQPNFFLFDYATNLFREDSTVATKFGLQDKSIFPISDDDASGNFFFRTTPFVSKKQELILITPAPNSAFKNKRFDISRITEHVHVNTFQEDNIMWFAGPDGIVRFDMSESPAPDKPFRTYLSKIILQRDSIFFKGIGNAPQSVSFPFPSNFRFEFTSTSFGGEEANEFQYKLEGFDDDWSEWTKENIKEYSRLWEGEYKFIVRSRNYSENLGITDEFYFIVTPPWFRSLYAYVAYFFMAALFVWGLIRYRLKSVLKEKEALQAEVAHQTREIREQNLQLAEQSEELKLNAEQLKELDKMKSNFFVNISHEFRTPLSLILSPLEKVIHERGSQQIRMTELERMHRNAKRLQQLINQLLDLAKLESGGMKLNPKDSDFVYFIRVLTSSFESLAESRNIHFDVSMQADSYHTRFDHEKVETVLYNLLSNAFKFTPDGGRIALRVNFVNENSSQLVSVLISDTGPGIPAGEVEKIFDRFYQLDSSVSREFEGSGIGLSLVKELVQLMKGTVQVDSKVGVGTSFSVQLPLERLASDSTPLQTEKDFEVNAITETPEIVTSMVDTAGDALILLVEDNADLRLFLKENLETDYQIALAENGLIGFEKSIELIPDLILSDMMMPGMDGFTLCTKIRQDERTSHIPFVLLTARATIESKLEGLEVGADEYMTKPFNIKELRVRIKNLLEQRNNLRKSFSREITVQPKNISITSVDERFLNRALEIMEAHLSDQQFSVERFAEEISMSRKNLLRKITALTDQSVNEFIRNFRLQRAAQLIAGRSASISEIAYQVGFNNLSYFSKCFKELFGTLPNDYPAAHQKVDAEDRSYEGPPENNFSIIK